MAEKHKFQLNFLHDRSDFLVTRLDIHVFKKVLVGLGTYLWIIILSDRLVILISLLVILTVIDVRVESVNFASTFDHILVEFMNT